MAKDTKDETKNSKFESFVRDKSFVGEENREKGTSNRGGKSKIRKFTLLDHSLLSLVKSILIVEFSVVCFACN